MRNSSLVKAERALSRGRCRVGDQARDIAIVIGVASSVPNKYLSGAVNGANAFAAWAKAQKYETLLVTDIDTGDLYRSRASGSVTPRLDRRTDLFEFKVKLKNIDTSIELTDAPEIKLPK